MDNYFCYFCRPHVSTNERKVLEIKSAGSFEEKNSYMYKFHIRLDIFLVVPLALHLLDDGEIEQRVPLSARCLQSLGLNVLLSARCLQSLGLNVLLSARCLQGLGLNVPLSARCLQGLGLNVPLSARCLQGLGLNVPLSTRCL